jgi:hypothetical protein
MTQVRTDTVQTDRDYLLAGDRAIIQTYLQESVDRLELAARLVKLERESPLPLHLLPEIEKLLAETASTLTHTILQHYLAQPAAKGNLNRKD